MAQKIYGIDIGTYSIKIAELERSLKTFELVSFYEHPIVYAESLSGTEAIASTLEKMVDEYGLREGIVYTAIPGSETATRLVELPFGSAKKVDQTLEFEMDGMVPVPLEDTLIDYHIVESTKTESTCLVSYVKKADLVKFLNIFSGADLDPRFIGCEPVEFGNVMHLGIIQPEGAYALLDVGHTKSNLCIFIGSKLYFARSLSYGGLHMTRAIAQRLQVPLEEAEKFKVEIGQVTGEAPDETTRNVSEAIREVLDKILIEIKQTLMNIQETEGQVVQALYLCGGTSRLSGIDNYFSYILRKNVSHLDCLDFPFNQLADSDWCRPIIPMSLALACRDVTTVKLPDIQFRRGEFAYRGGYEQLGGIAKQAAILAGAIIFFVSINFGVNYFALTNKVNQLNNSLAEKAGKVLTATPPRMLKSPESVISILNGKILEAQEAEKEMAGKVNLSYLKTLLALAEFLPARDDVKLDVDEFNMAGDRIRIEGRTTSFEAVDKIKQAVAKSALFHNVSTGNVKKSADNLISFNLTMQVALNGSPVAIGMREKR